MSLFGKKKEEKKEACCCECGDKAADKSADKSTAEAPASSSCCGGTVSGICCIKVLGTGCKNCHTLYENAKEAAEKAGLGLEVEYVTELEKVMEYGVMSTPALVVNEQVVSMGRVLSASDVRKIIGKFI